MRQPLPTEMNALPAALHEAEITRLSYISLSLRKARRGLGLIILMAGLIGLFFLLAQFHPAATPLLHYKNQVLSLLFLLVAANTGAYYRQHSKTLTIRRNIGLKTYDTYTKVAEEIESSLTKNGIVTFTRAAYGAVVSFYFQEATPQNHYEILPSDFEALILAKLPNTHVFHTRAKNLFDYRPAESP